MELLSLEYADLSVAKNELELVSSGQTLENRKPGLYPSLTEEYRRGVWSRGLSIWS